jgi:hypothetical protein
MIDVLQIITVELNMQLCVLMVAKCKQSSILTSIQNTNSLANRTKDTKYSAYIKQISILLEILNTIQKKTVFEK